MANNVAPVVTFALKDHISWKYLEKYIEPSDCEKTVVSENHFDLNYWYFISNGGTP